MEIVVTLMAEKRLVLRCLLSVFCGYFREFPQYDAGLQRRFVRRAGAEISFYIRLQENYLLFPFFKLEYFIGDGDFINDLNCVFMYIGALAVICCGGEVYPTVLKQF